jgi:hypothetical protein
VLAINVLLKFERLIDETALVEGVELEELEELSDVDDIKAGIETVGVEVGNRPKDETDDSDGVGYSEALRAESKEVWAGIGDEGGVEIGD